MGSVRGSWSPVLEGAESPFPGWERRGCLPLCFPLAVGEDAGRGCEQGQDQDFVTPVHLFGAKTGKAEVSGTLGQKSSRASSVGWRGHFLGQKHQLLALDPSPALVLNLASLEEQERWPGWGRGRSRRRGERLPFLREGPRQGAPGNLPGPQPWSPPNWSGEGAWGRRESPPFLTDIP